MAVVAMAAGSGRAGLGRLGQAGLGRPRGLGPAARGADRAAGRADRHGVVVRRRECRPARHGGEHRPAHAGGVPGDRQAVRRDAGVQGRAGGLAAAGGRALDPAGARRPGAVRPRRHALAQRARPVLPHPQDRAARRGAGGLRGLDHRPQALPGRHAHGPAGRRERPGDRADQAQSAGGLVARGHPPLSPPAPAAAASAGGARLPVDRLPALHARRSRTARKRAPGAGGSSTRPSAASTAARASEPEASRSRTARRAMRPRAGSPWIRR